MPELEQRIRTWAATGAADVEPVTLDEVLSLAAGASIADDSAHDVPRRHQRTWLAAAAVVVLLAATLVGVALLQPDDGGVADTDLAPTMERLIQLGPAEFPTEGEDDAFGGGWMDVEHARETAGLEPPHADASDEERSEYLDELYVTTGADPAGVSTLFDGQLDWWLEIAIDPTTVDGYVGWGAFPDDSRAVLVGDFDTDAIDDAARTNSGSERLEVDQHRGVTTYAWGDDGEVLALSNPSDHFPGFRALRMAVVDDETVLMARTTAALQEMIDRALDGGPTVADDPAMAMLTALDDVYGFQIIELAGSPYASWAILDAPWEEGDPQRLITTLAAPGASADALASEIQSAGDAALVRLVDDGIEEFQEAEISVGVDGDVIWVDLLGAPDLNPRDPTNPNYQWFITRPLLLFLGIFPTGEDQPENETASDEVMTRLIELGPSEFVTEAEWNPTWSPWMDVAAARDAAGLDLPPADASTEETLEYFGDLRAQTGADPLPMGSFAENLGSGTTFLDWWSEIGIEPARIDGYVRNDELPDGDAVVVGTFDVNAIDQAARTNSGSDTLSIDEYRGVTTYAWGDDLEILMTSDAFPGFRSMRLAAIDDQTVVLARTTPRLHEMIDRALDGGSTVADDPAMAMLDTADDPYGFTIVRTVDGPYSAWASLYMVGEPDGPARLATAQVRSGESTDALAEQIEQDANAVLEEFAETSPDLADAVIDVTVEGDILIVEAFGLPEVDIDDEDQLQRSGELSMALIEAIGVVDMSHNDEIMSFDEEPG